MNQEDTYQLRRNIQRALAAVPRTIAITPTHIEFGEPKHCDTCPVALATIDAYSIADAPWAIDFHVSVNSDGTMSIWFYGEDDTVYTQWNLPHKLRDFIARFDQSIGGVLPVTFTPSLMTVVHNYPE